MNEQKITVSNRLGLHARASAKLVQLVHGFKSTLWQLSDTREVTAQSFMA
jgi:phosphocarrier protein